MTTWGGIGFVAIRAGSAMTRPLTVANQSFPSRLFQAPCCELLHSAAAMRVAVEKVTCSPMRPGAPPAAASSACATRKMPRLLANQRNPRPSSRTRCAAS